MGPVAVHRREGEGVLSFFLLRIYLFIYLVIIIFEEVGLFVMKILLMNFKENKNAK